MESLQAPSPKYNPRESQGDIEKPGYCGSWLNFKFRLIPYQIWSYDEANPAVVHLNVHRPKSQLKLKRLYPSPPETNMYLVTSAGPGDGAFWKKKTSKNAD